MTPSTRHDAVVQPPLAAELTGFAVVTPPALDPDVTLLTPVDDVADPVLSIVIPAMNEELTIADFVAWCRQGLDRAGVRGEILIVDSSSDRTAELAVAGGARVLTTPKRGLGRAYIDALPYVRGRWIVMGDADCTYDFRQLAHFVERFREGYEFVMGSRWKGSIEPGSMPALHQYMGTPVTTWILNLLYGSKFSDIHCGMRGITRDALTRMRLQSQSWEYASEMVLKSVHMKLRTAEVPVAFLKDREGRVSHHKRLGWFSPFQAAWINLRAMFVYGADFFLLKPGLALLLVGLLISLPVTFGPFSVGPVTFSLYWMLLGVALAIVGLQSFYLGCIVQVLHDYTGRATQRWTSLFRYTRTTFISAAMFVAGLALASVLLAEYVRSGLKLHALQLHATYIAVTGLLLMMMSFMTFTSTLLIHAAALRRPGSDDTRR
ncbi:MAG TPA: glycosyltransferase family 2 protein [Candidatus Dormibacteraeota bacterium]|nr:glycosyltransferase family 2 protein [Candidatus Dormibacteraeota bacterium]